MNFFQIKDNQKHPLFFPYWRMRMSYPLWRFWFNQRAARFWKKRAAPLASASARIVKILERDGIALAPFSELFGDTAFAPLAAAAEKLFHESAFEQRVREQRAGTGHGGGNKKDFFAYALGAPLGGATRLPIENPLIRFALSEELVQIAAHYFRFVPQLSSFSLLQTLVASGDDKAKFSQRWHRDPEDRKVLKVFLYLNDVDAGTGPFSYVKKSHEGGKWRHLYPQIPPYGSYPPDGALEKIIPPEDMQVCTAPRATLIFADTSGFHRGGFCTERDRFHFVAGFTSWGAAQPVTYLPPSSSEAASLGPLGRYAVGLS